jgi:hypothetical protein
MILVYDTFVCKPGNASKVAKMFKEAMAKNPYLMGIMTDMSGQYHRVVMATGYKTLAEFEKSYEEMMNNPTPEMKEAMEKMKGMQDMYTTGSREIYKTW